MREIEKILTKEDILEMTNGGMDIFLREGCKNQRKHQRSVFSNDKTPSMQIKNKGNIVTFACYSSGRRGDAVTFICELYGLTFKEALEKIKNDFNLSPNGKQYERIIPLERIAVEEPPIEIDWERMPFKKKHHEYFNTGHLQESFLNSINVYALKNWAINKKAQEFTEGQFSFVYECPEGCKILNLGENVKPYNKWRTSVKKHYLWNFDKYNNVKDLFIAKSVKDMAILLLLGRNACSVQSENSSVLIENMPKILEKCNSPIINFGSNEIDKNKSIEVTKEFPQLRWFNTPNSLLKFGIEDNFDYSKAYGLKSFENLLKRKKL